MPVIVTPQVNETTAPVQFDGAVTAGGVSITAGASSLSPSNMGLLAWNFPTTFNTGTGSAVTTGGLLYLSAVNLTGGVTYANPWIRIATAASGATSGQNFAGLYNSAGVLQVSSNDMTTVIGTNTGYIKGTFATPFIPAASGTYYFGCFFNAGTTLPVLGTVNGGVTVTTSAAAAGSATGILTAATFPYAVSATSGNTTALPASITMSSNTATGAYIFWCGLS